jgi:hypothetical protein
VSDVRSDKKEATDEKARSVSPPPPFAVPASPPAGPN